jgi:hypothetical protein
MAWPPTCCAGAVAVADADAVLVLRVPLVALTSWHLLQMLARLL